MLGIFYSLLGIARPQAQMVVPSGLSHCSSAGFPNLKQDPLSASPGTRLAETRVTQTIGSQLCTWQGATSRKPSETFGGGYMVGAQMISCLGGQRGMEVFASLRGMKASTWDLLHFQKCVFLPCVC